MFFSIGPNQFVLEGIQCLFAMGPNFCFPVGTQFSFSRGPNVRARGDPMFVFEGENGRATCFRDEMQRRLAWGQQH